MLLLFLTRFESRNKDVVDFQLKEWDINNVILTGNSDGVVRVSALEIFLIRPHIYFTLAHHNGCLS